MSMRLTILGSGSPEPCMRRASSGYLLEIANNKLLFDCGGGVFDRLLAAGYRPSDIDCILFSHLHSDHMMDFARLVHAAWDESGKSFQVFGPPPIGEITDKLFGRDGVFAHDIRARTELAPSQEVWVARGGSLPRPWPSLGVTEVLPGFAHAAENWQITSCEVPHAQPALQCMAFSVTDGSSKFVYSGDAGICDELENLCQSADLLLHWCYRLDGEQTHSAMADMTPTPKEIASMAQRCGVKRLILTHFRAHMDSPEIQANVKRELSKNFSGIAGIAEDLQICDIGT